MGFTFLVLAPRLGGLLNPHCPRVLFAMGNCYLYLSCIFNRGETDVEKNCIELNSQPVGMERLNKMIYVGCMDDTLKCFTSKVCGGILR